MPSFDVYEYGVRRLLEKLGPEHSRYTEALTLQSRLRENLDGAREYGDDENRRAGQAQIIGSLNRLALETTRVSFHALCEGQPAHALDLPPCPFVAGPKITDPRLFVGRKEELRRLVTAMEGAQPISINVVGERRIGKSSLLYHLYQTWEQRVQKPARYVVAYLSLQDAAAQTERDFYRAVARALVARPSVQQHSAIVEALTRQPLGRTVQLICYEVVERLNRERRRRATPADVAAVIPAVFERGSQYFREFWEETLGPEQRQALVSLVQEGEIGAGGQAAVKFLIAKEVLEPMEGTYRFQVPLVRLWVAQKVGIA